MKITALAGGVGGSKLCAGLADVMQPEDLSVVVNIGDDFNYYGLRVCPDLDTVCYTLAGLNNPVTGWGLENETWNFSDGISMLGGESWFKIGDRDAATHLLRTDLLQAGSSLTEITRKFCQQLGIKVKVSPASDDVISTIVITADGRRLPFQEYFVKERCEPVVAGFEFAGLESAKAGIEVLAAMENADWIIICPSNPWVSVDPIISIGGIREILREKKVLAVSPLIRGKAVKGPAAKMFEEMGILPGAAAVAGHYRQFLNAFVLDSYDTPDAEQISRWGIITVLKDILMPTREERRRLANDLLAFCNTH
jgi:LPPG:FO 2-phospho-L-lactate transferase